MKSMDEVLVFLNELEKRKISHSLTKVRPESLMVIAVVPGQRWEIEIMKDGEIEVEKFVSDGKIYDAKELAVLFERYSD